MTHRKRHLRLFLLAALAGVPAGLIFPAASRTFGGGAEETAAVLYGADLAGGIGGALLVGPLLLPALGIGGTMHFEVVPLVASATVLFVLGAAAGGSRAKGREGGETQAPVEGEGGAGPVEGGSPGS